MRLGIFSNGLIDESLEQAILAHDAWTLSGITHANTNNHPSAPLTDDELIKNSDAIYISAHYPEIYKTASALIRTGKHIYLESMANLAVEQVDDLLRQCREANLSGCTGTPTHGHSAFRTLLDLQTQADIVELHRQYPIPNNTAWRTILYEDLAIILTLIQSEIKRISASSLSMLSNDTDLIDIRLEFANGQTAHLQINLSGHTHRHKLFLFERGRRVSTDFIDNRIRIRQQATSEEFLHPVWKNPYSTQLDAFYKYIHRQAPALLSLQTVHTLLSTLSRIEEKINS